MQKGNVPDVRVNCIYMQSTFSLLQYELVGGNANSFTITGLRVATTYRFAVRVIPSDGNAVNPVESKEKKTDDGRKSNRDVLINHKKCGF